MNLWYISAFAQVRMGQLIDFINQGLVAAGTDVANLLTGDGAAGGGGALEEVSNQVNQYGKGVYSIISTAAIYIVAIALVGSGIGMAIHAGNANKRDDAKSAIVWRIVAAVFIFAAVSILVFAQKIGSALVG